MEKSYNLKQKSGIKNYINIQFDGNKPKFQDGRIRNDFLALLKMYALSKFLKHENVLHFKVMCGYENFLKI
jgi:hypothetical protein